MRTAPTCSAFRATALRYVRFDLSECPQPEILPFPACAIGEVAFAEVRAPFPSRRRPPFSALA